MNDTREDVATERVGPERMPRRGERRSKRIGHAAALGLPRAEVDERRELPPPFGPDACAVVAGERARVREVRHDVDRAVEAADDREIAREKVREERREDEEREDEGAAPREAALGELRAGDAQRPGVRSDLLASRGARRRQLRALHPREIDRQARIGRRA